MHQFLVLYLIKLFINLQTQKISRFILLYSCRKGIMDGWLGSRFKNFSCYDSITCIKYVILFAKLLHTFSSKPHPRFHFCIRPLIHRSRVIVKYNVPSQKARTKFWSDTITTSIQFYFRKTLLCHSFSCSCEYRKRPWGYSRIDGSQFYQLALRFNCN